MKFAVSVIMIIFFPVFSFGYTYTQSDVYWLTKNIYWESRGEPFEGQLMVGLVTIERLKSGKWGSSIKEVVTAKHQFSWTSDKKSRIPVDKESWKRCKDIALLAITVYDVFGKTNIMWYHNTKVYPKWAYHKHQVIKIGNHIFYK